MKLNTLSVLLILLLVQAGCRSNKPIGSTSIKNKTYPTADGYAQEPLAYKYTALKGCSEEKIKLHYKEKHTALLTAVNKDIFAHESMMGKSLEELLQSVSKLPKDIQQSIRVNGGGHWNYSFFWKGLTTKADTEPSAKLLQAIKNKWGSMEGFKKAFNKATQVKYGQCWVFLVNTETGLKISVTQDNDNPLMDVSKVNGKPILVALIEQQNFALTNGNGMDGFWANIDWERASKLLVE